MQSLLDHALAYAANGWYVFPCAPGDKVPITGNGHLDATVDPAQIRLWWTSIPQANIGIALAPSRLVVLDIDVGFDKQGVLKPGAASLAELEREIGTLPATLAQRTARAGLHAVFSRPEDVEPKRRIGFKPGLDLLGEGYIVAQPSRLVGSAFEGAPAHATGSYSWVDPTALPLPLPAALTQAAQRGTKARVLPAGEVSAPIVTGDRNNALFRLGCSLRDTGLDEQALTLALLATNSQRFQPPLDEAEVYTVAASVMRRVAPTRDVAANAVFADVFRNAPLDTLGKLQSEQRERKPESGDVEVATKAYSLVGAVALRPTLPVKRYATQFPEFNEMTRGISTRQLGVLVGKPGGGKTAFILDLIFHVQGALPSLYISTELETLEIIARIAAKLIGCPWTAIVDDAVDGSLRKQAAEALKDLRIAVIGQDELPNDTNEILELIATQAIAMKTDFGVSPWIIGDYAQDMARGAGDEQSMRFRIGGLARMFRVMSQVLDCPVLLVSSTARALYGAGQQSARVADDPRVYLAAAKESGDIDYAAAVVLYLDTGDEEDAEGWTPGRLAVAKSRHGRCGFVGLKFHGATGRWKPEAASVVTMSRDGQGGAKLERKNGEDDETVINKVRVLMGQGEGSLKSRSGLREVCGINKARAEKAIERCLGDGRLVLREIEVFDRFHKARRVAVVSLPSADVAAAPMSTPSSDPALEKMLAGRSLT